MNDLLHRSFRTFWSVARIMAPVMLLVRLAELAGLSDLLGVALAPVMALVGLPGEAVIVWAIAILVGISGGLGALVALAGSLDMNVAQFNILICMMMFAHAIPVEQAVVAKAGGNFWLTSSARFFSAITCGVAIDTIAKLTGWWQAPADLGLMPGAPTSADWFTWLGSVAYTLAVMFVILLALLAIIDGLKKIGLFDAITRFLVPYFKRLGIVPELAPLTTIGMLIGLAYGGGLIIEEAKRLSLSKRDLLAPLVALSVLHAVIEDSVLVLVFGADFWIAIVFRTAFALMLLVIFAWVLDRWFPKPVAHVQHPH